MTLQKNATAICEGNCSTSSDTAGPSDDVTMHGHAVIWPTNTEAWACMYSGPTSPVAVPSAENVAGGIQPQLLFPGAGDFGEGGIHIPAPAAHQTMYNL